MLSRLYRDASKCYVYHPNWDASAIYGRDPVRMPAVGEHNDACPPHKTLQFDLGVVIAFDLNLTGAFELCLWRTRHRI